MFYFYRGYERYFDFTKHMRFVDSEERLEGTQGDSPERPWSVISGLILNSAPKDFREALENTKTNFVTTEPKQKPSRNKKKRIYLAATANPKQRSPGSVNEEGVRI